MDKRSVAIVASLVASLVATSAVAKTKTTKSTSSKVKCSGVNDCKAKSECSGTDHSCKGKNDCKGKGWVSVASAKACTTKGGTVVTADAKGAKDPMATPAAAATPATDAMPK